ncbi:MAG TPA: hypothetical protein VJZ76_08965 [Thermoanaerobaculia bacterium]|nr:hypothetical protein [Thermoanaerobaculia bacterium]
MRLGALVPVCLLAASLHAAVTTTPPVPVPKVVHPPQRITTLRHHPLRPGNLVTDLDARVLAALFASIPASDFDFAVRTGEVGLCEGSTCSVPVMIKLPETAPPMKIAIAVSNAKGEISEVRHAECVTQQCTIRLVLERGRNTIAVGAGDTISQTAGITLTTVEASPNISLSQKAKTEWF